jgi:nitrile hydratase
VAPGPRAVGAARSQSSEVVFNVGDTVQVEREDAAIFWLRPHLRTPGYIFGKRGVVERVCGRFPSPELLAFGIEGQSTMLYRVRFQQRMLWDAYEGSETDSIEVELYEPWLRVPTIDQAGATIEDSHAAAAVHEDGGHAHSSGHEHGGHAHSSGHEHGHEHSHEHEGRAMVEQAAVDREPRAGPYRRVAEALKVVLVEKGLVCMDEIMAEIAAQDMNHMTHEAGARVVARAWRDAGFRARLLADGKAAVRDLCGIDLDCGQLLVVENGPSLHNLVVCTLCSCYPGALLGKPPDWYKSRSYRSRAVFEPRRVLAGFGMELEAGTELRVHDSTADMRYLVLPELPALPDGARVEDLDEESLMALVTRDSMIGAGVARAPPAAATSKRKNRDC